VSYLPTTSTPCYFFIFLVIENVQVVIGRMTWVCYNAKSSLLVNLKCVRQGESKTFLIGDKSAFSHHFSCVTHYLLYHVTLVKRSWFYFVIIFFGQPPLTHFFLYSRFVSQLVEKIKLNFEALFTQFPLLEFPSQ